MFNLKRFFQRRKPADESALAVAGPVFLSVRIGEQRIIDADEIELAFRHSLLGVGHFLDDEMSFREAELLRQLTDLLDNPRQLAAELPRVPMVLPQLIRALRSDRNSAQDLARLISDDAQLVGDVMRLMSSPIYRTRGKITSLDHAVAMLGRDGLRRLVASAVTKPLIQASAGHFSETSAALLWTLAERTAHAAQGLAGGEDEVQFHAYLAGLLMNLGLNVGLRWLDRHSKLADELLSAGFANDFRHYGRVISHRIVQSWALPAPVVDAIGRRVTANFQPVNDIERALLLAEPLAMVQPLASRLGLGGDVSDLEVLVSGRPDACGQKMLLELSAENG